MQQRKHCRKSMIRLPEFEGGPLAPPEPPLKSWREKFEMKNLYSMDLVMHFQASSPQYFIIDQTAEYSELGKQRKHKKEF